MTFGKWSKNVLKKGFNAFFGAMSAIDVGTDVVILMFDIFVLFF